MKRVLGMVSAFPGPFLFMVAIGAIATSAGAVTCRTIIRKKGRQTGT